MGAGDRGDDLHQNRDERGDAVVEVDDRAAREIESAHRPEPSPAPTQCATGA